MSVGTLEASEPIIVGPGTRDVTPGVLVLYPFGRGPGGPKDRSQRNRLFAPVDFYPRDTPDGPTVESARARRLW